MADSTIGGLSASSAVGGTDVFPSSQGGGSATKTTATQIATFILATPTITGHATIEGVTATGATGTGKIVFDTAPTLGVVTVTSINKTTITAPASSSTLTIANGKTFTSSNTITLTGTDSVSANISNLKIRTIGFSALLPVTGQQGSYVVFPVAGTITGWTIVADTGTATVSCWKIASGTTAPTISNIINTSGVALSTGTAIISSTTSDFTTTTVAANDIFAFNLTAVSGATKLLFELQITVT